MSLASLVPIVMQLTIFLMVAALGLRVWPPAPAQRRYGLLVRSLVALNVIVPALAIALVLIFDPVRPVKLALVLLAISPIPPFLPGKLLKLSDDGAFVYALLVVASILSIVLVPLSIELLAALTGRDATMPAVRVLRIMLLSILVPLTVGVLIRRSAPSFATRIEPVVQTIATALLTVVLLVILFTAGPAILSLIGNGTILVIALFVGLALAVGHSLGGPDHAGRVILAQCAAARHPGIALAITTYNFPTERAAAAAVLLYLLVNAVVTIPYTMWWKRSHEFVAPRSSQASRPQE